MAKNNTQPELDDEAKAALGIGTAPAGDGPPKKKIISTESAPSEAPTRERNLTGLEGGKPAAQEQPQTPAAKATTKPVIAAETAEVDRKSSKSYLLTQGVQNRVQNAVVALQKLEDGIQLGGFVEDALMAAVKKAERKYNDGKPFASPSVGPRRGRPIG